MEIKKLELGKVYVVTAPFKVWTEPSPNVPFRRILLDVGDKIVLDEWIVYVSGPNDIVSLFTLDGENYNAWADDVMRITEAVNEHPGRRHL